MQTKERVRDLQYRLEYAVVRLVAGIVTHRQRPMTAQGTTFMKLEEETWQMNIVVTKGCRARHRVIARESPALLVRGRLERSEVVINVISEQLVPLAVSASASALKAHDTIAR